ncbi:MAG: cell division protein FtsA [Treponema sp.]|nr:cell division protein FtsA [Spirochaetia bacterium]MDY2839543.1 cell division protein FtsA [Treponema sp.]MDY5123594.1 cell division protein FtsA [Treponema sp.]
MADGIVVGLDIGTSVIRVAIGELNVETGKIQIAGTAARKSAGLRNGIIVNIEEAKEAIRLAVEDAVQNSGILVESVITAIGGSQIVSQNSRGTVPVSSSGRGNKEINTDDIARVIESATAIPVPADREKLHVIPQNYIVDGIGGISDPIHRMGTRLEAEVHIVTASKNIIQNINTCVSRANYRLDGVMLKTLAATQAVCHQDEMDLGSILIDLGAGTTDIIVLINGSPVSTASVPVGGSLVTNDIAIVTGIPSSAAEDIKLKSGCCWLQGITEENDEEVILPGVGGRAPEIIYKSQLCQIIQARMEQIFRMSKDAIIKNTNNSIRQLSGNIILTGGGAQMDGVIELAQNVFKTSSVRLGVPENLGGIEENYRRPDFATAVGLVVANQGLAKSKPSYKKSKFKKEKSSNEGENPIKRFFKTFF